MTATALARVTELDRYVSEISRYPLLDAAQELDLARRWRDERDVGAAHALVTSNLRFVVKIAYEYKGYGARMLDLVQEGSIGLMQAVRRFDPDRGYRLLSYAVYWIRSYIHSFLMRTRRMVKLGTSRAHRRLFFKLRALKGTLEARGMDSRDDIIDAVAEAMNVDRQDVEEMDRHLTGGDASLDEPLASTGTALVEVLPSSDRGHDDLLEEMEEAADRSARLEAAMAALDDREKSIIEARYLIEAPRQFHDIGAELGISKQRVFQLERRALDKLRRALRSDDIPIQAAQGARRSARALNEAENRPV